jgi:5-methyltetrahydrofolate--homocysteine methyltransferase
MSIEGLTLIGEFINASIPSTEALFESGDFDGVRELATMQDVRGAQYIDVNVGRRPPEFMAEAVAHVQAATAKPLSIDTPDPATAEAGLRAYDPAKSEGHAPILNSVSPLRLEMFDLHSVQPFRPMLMISERSQGGAAQPNETAEEIHETASEMLAEARERVPSLSSGDCIFDPGIASIGGDLDGSTNRLMEALSLIRQDSALAGAHISVGLSNFTAMLPSRCANGSPVKSQLESAFLTMAIPRGLDTIIGSVKRKYELLPESHRAVQCLSDVLNLRGPERLRRLMDFYS